MTTMKLLLESDKESDSADAFRIVFRENKTAAYWATVENEHLVLFWSKGEGPLKKLEHIGDDDEPLSFDPIEVTPLPYSMDVNFARQFVLGWLKNGAKYPRVDDYFDGTIKEGFEIFTSYGYDICNNWGAFCRISAKNIYYGK